MLNKVLKLLETIFTDKKSKNYQQLRGMVGMMVTRTCSYESDNLFQDYFENKSAILLAVDPVKGIKLDTMDEFKKYFGIDTVIHLPASYIDDNWKLVFANIESISGGDIRTAA